MQYVDGYSYGDACKRAAKASASKRGLWYVVQEARRYHVLSELEAFDLWCVRDDQIVASFIGGQCADE